MNRSFTVLIVDDDEDDRSIFCDIITEIYPHATCITAINGLDALNKLQARRNPVPNIIFLDINMPKMNGKKCLSHLKASPATRGIPVVIYTTSRLEEDMKETKALGATNFLSKPSKSIDLKCGIKRIIDEVMQTETMKPAY